MTLKAEIKQSAKPVPVSAVQYILSSTDKIIVYTRHKRICVFAEGIIRNKVIPACKIEKRVPMIEQWCRSNYLIRAVIDQESEIAEVSVYVAYYCIKHKHIIKCIREILTQCSIILPDRFHTALSDKSADWYKGIILACKKLTGGA